jgi:hypothetical protein
VAVEEYVGFVTQAAQALPVRPIAPAEDIGEVVVLAATNTNITGTIIETTAVRASSP